MAYALTAMPPVGSALIPKVVVVSSFLWLCERNVVELTSVNCLWCLLLLGACIVLIGRLGMNACCRTILVEVAVLVHSQLESVVLPAEDVVTMCCRATESNSQ